MLPLVIIMQNGSQTRKTLSSSLNICQEYLEYLKLLKVMATTLSDYILKVSKNKKPNELFVLEVILSCHGETRPYFVQIPPSPSIQYLHVDSHSHVTRPKSLHKLIFQPSPGWCWLGARRMLLLSVVNIWKMKCSNIFLILPPIQIHFTESSHSWKKYDLQNF